LDLGEKFGRLLERLLGREYQEPTAAPPPPARRSNQRKGIARDPAGARAIDSIDPPARGELRLTVEGPVDEPDGAGRRRAGFDPYSSDGGFAKPRSWDDVPRK
jgi:hypothetical protein